MTVATAIRRGTKLLQDACVTQPKLTAEVLLSHALHRDRVFVMAHPEHELSETASMHYGRYIQDRARGKPLQYITMKQEFYGRSFFVTPAVLIPRPETELVVEEALARCEHGGALLDIGTGSGAIAVTLAAASDARVYACDISADALSVASDNAHTHSARVQMVRSDLTSAFACRSFDLVVSNPPYVKESDREGMQVEVRDFEPALALFAGASGSEIYRRIFDDAPRVLKPGGRLVLELGHDSLETVTSLAASRFDDVVIRDDLAGIQRVFSAKLRA